MVEGVEFEENRADNGAPGKPSYGAPSGGYGRSSVRSSSDSDPAMVRWLKARGLAKSNVAAQGILIGVIVINAIIIFVVLRYFL